MNGVWRNRLLDVLAYFGILFFISSVLTASFVLFFQGLDIPQDTIRRSAVLTFGNALFISFLVWLVDRLRKKAMIDRPVKRISDGLERLTEGDFSGHIEIFADPLGNNQYNMIIGQINKMADELAGVETLRTDFVSNVSHEMKTPLAVIQNYAALLRSPDLNDSPDNHRSRADTPAASSAYHPWQS